MNIKNFMIFKFELKMDNFMKNLLCIANRDSLPYSDGGKIETFFPAKYFKKYFNVFMTFPVSKLNDDLLNKYSKYGIIAKPYILETKDSYLKYPLSLFSNLSFKLSKYYCKSVLKYLSKIVSENNIDFIWANSPHSAKYAIELKKMYPNLKIILREHNIEYKLVKQFSSIQNNLLMKFISYYEYLKTKKYEIDIWKKFDKVYFISDSDLEIAKKYNNFFTEENVLYSGMETNCSDNIETEDNSFIFTGSLNSFQNKKNLKFFIEHIWCEFNKCEPNAKLYITGNTEETLRSKLSLSNDYLKNHNIINLGYVDDIQKTIMSMKYVISPTLCGSGIRLKVLEGLSLKKIVFVSDIDYNMAKCFKDMNNIVHYNDFESFYDKYKKIQTNNELYNAISLNGFNLKEKYFNWDNYAEKVYKEMLEL